MSSEPQLTDSQLDALVDDVVDRLDHGEVLDDKLVLDRRRLMQLVASGVIGIGALKELSEPAAAQAVGQLGTSSERIDVYGETGDFAALEADEGGIKRLSKATYKAAEFSTTGSGTESDPYTDGIQEAFDQAASDGLDTVRIDVSGVVDRSGKGPVNPPAHCRTHRSTSG